MNVKRTAKRILKQLGIKLPVKYSTDFCLSYNEDDEIDCMYVPHPFHKMDLEQLRIDYELTKYTENLCKVHNIPLNMTLFNIYHEIGHIVCGINDLKEYEIELNLLEKLFREDKIDEFQYISLYNMMEDEKNANNWAIQYIKENSYYGKSISTLSNSHGN